MHPKPGGDASGFFSPAVVTLKLQLSEEHRLCSLRSTGIIVRDAEPLRCSKSSARTGSRGACVQVCGYKESDLTAPLFLSLPGIRVVMTAKGTEAVTEKGVQKAFVAP